MPTFCEVSHLDCLQHTFLIHSLLHTAENGHKEHCIPPSNDACQLVK